MNELTVMPPAGGPPRAGRRLQQLGVRKQLMLFLCAVTLLTLGLVWGLITFWLNRCTTATSAAACRARPPPWRR